MLQPTIKMIHILAASTAFMFFIFRAYPIVINHFWQPSSSIKNKVLVACQHSSYTVVVATGIWLLYNKHFIVQPWFYGKISLFVLILVASAIGFKRRMELSINTRKKALVLAFISFLAIVTLIAIKPQFG